MQWSDARVGSHLDPTCHGSNLPRIPLATDPTRHGSNPPRIPLAGIPLATGPAQSTSSCRQAPLPQLGSASHSAILAAASCMREFCRRVTRASAGIEPHAALAGIEPHAASAGIEGWTCVSWNRTACRVSWNRRLDVRQLESNRMPRQLESKVGRASAGIEGWISWAPSCPALLCAMLP